MKPYADYTRSERCAEYAALQEQYDAWKAKGLSLNMARGKPAARSFGHGQRHSDRAAVSGGLLRRRARRAQLWRADRHSSAKRLFAELLGVTPSQVLVGGSASLNLMYDLIAKA